MLIESRQHIPLLDQMVVKMPFKPAQPARCKGLFVALWTSGVWYLPQLAEELSQSPCSFDQTKMQDIVYIAHIAGTKDPATQLSGISTRLCSCSCVNVDARVFAAGGWQILVRFSVATTQKPLPSSATDPSKWRVMYCSTVFGCATISVPVPSHRYSRGVEVGLR